MKKVLITGATGNVGAAVARQLADLKQETVCAVRTPDASETASPQSEARVRFDFGDPTTFASALEGVDRVFLMRPPQLGKPDDLYPFIAAMAQAGVQLVSFLSLMGVESNPVPPHHKIEKRIEEVGLPFAHVRPGFFMQNVSGVHAYEIRREDRIYIPAGRAKTSFVDAEDVGAAAAHLLADPEKYRNSAHTITGPEALDYFQVARILSDLTGRAITYAKPSLIGYRQHAIHRRGLEAAYVNVTVMLYVMTRLGAAKAVTHDFEHIAARPPRTFREFALANRSAFEKSA